MIPIKLGTDSNVVKVFARTYGRSDSRDGWDRVQDYRRVIEYTAEHPKKGSQAVATALEIPLERIRPWIDDEARPDPVRGIQTTEAHGWLDLDWDGDTVDLEALGFDSSSQQQQQQQGAAQQQQQQQGETSIDDSGGWDGGTILIGGDTFTNNQSVVVSNTIVNENTNTNTNENVNTNTNDVDVGGGGNASGGDGGDGGVTTTAAGSGGTATATDTTTATTTTAATTTAATTTAATTTQTSNDVPEGEELNFTIEPNTANTEVRFTTLGADNGSNVNESTEGSYASVIIRAEKGLNFTKSSPLSTRIFGVDRNGDDPGTEIDESFKDQVQSSDNNKTTISAQFQESPVNNRFPNANAGDELVSVVGGDDANNDGEPDIVTTDETGEHQVVIMLSDENGEFTLPPSADSFNVTSG
jgi:hypothetical protein